MDDVNPGVGPGADTGAGLGAVGADSRIHHNLRPIFFRACQITAPFFDSKQSWGGSSLAMYARQTLREAFPELTQQEMAILFSAVQRFHKATPGL